LCFPPKGRSGPKSWPRIYKSCEGVGGGGALNEGCDFTFGAEASKAPWLNFKVCKTSTFQRRLSRGWANSGGWETVWVVSWPITPPSPPLWAGPPHQTNPHYHIISHFISKDLWKLPLSLSLLSGNQMRRRITPSLILFFFRGNERSLTTQEYPLYNIQIFSFLPSTEYRASSIKNTIRTIWILITLMNSKHVLCT
jgi:hypothetical protein